jgi:malate dehydrogenase (oxaloacetate-decarboxylating)(NADP+)
VSNGTAVLGLGDIGPLAGKPVMEGKAVLFKTFADLDVFDLEIDAPTPDDVVRFCEMLAPTVGGINLEDIKAPDCFEVEERLRDKLGIPVFHDDQHGTAIISGAALLNACELVGKPLDAIRVVFVGAGAAGIATAEHYVRLGVRREAITLCDRAGVIHAGRTDLDPYQARFAHPTERRTVAAQLEGADVLVGLSVAGAVRAEWLAGMARDPIVFALANPEPEVLPDEVRAVRPDAIVATGRSDFPNQVNNVLGFPFIFRGALDARATRITEEMKMAATRALAALAKEDVPDGVLRAYNVESLRFGREYLIPKPFDSRVLLWVAPAVAWAAIASGVAQHAMDEDEYRDQLEARIGRGRAVMRSLSHRAAQEPQRVAFTDGAEPRVIRAAKSLAEEGIAAPVLVGARAAVEASIAALGFDAAEFTIVDPASDPRRDAFAEQLWARRRRRGLTRDEARWRLHQAEYFVSMLAETGHVDAAILGASQTYPRAIRPALESVGALPGATVAGIYMMVLQQGVYFFADCTVNIDPDAETLAEIGASTADFVAGLGLEARVAMLSFSNFGSARHPRQARVADAAARLRARRPDLMVDGEMQADTAVVEELLTGSYPFSALTRPANVLIFPDLDAANICYKLLERLGGAQAIGPILVGMAAPLHVLQRGARVETIVNLAVIAAVDALERRRRRANPLPT